MAPTRISQASHRHAQRPDIRLHDRPWGIRVASRLPPANSSSVPCPAIWDVAHRLRTLGATWLRGKELKRPSRRGRCQSEPAHGGPMSELDQVLSHIDAELDPAIERLFALLRIRSISTDPAYAAECRACAEWHAADLRSIGFDAGARADAGPSDGGRPRPLGASGPSALFYGHYDVQPVDPIELWEQDPVRAVHRDARRRVARHPRARGCRRQGPGDDVRRGLPCLEGGHRQAADPDLGPDRGRGGVGRRQPAALSARRTPTNCAPISG